MQSTKTLLLKPLSGTLGVGSRAAPSLEATLPTMSMKAAADMAVLETSDGFDLAGFTWEVSISAGGEVVGQQQSPGIVGRVACYLTSGLEQGAELYAAITLAPDAMRDLVTASANGFVPIGIWLKISGASGEETPDGATLVWDTDNEPEIEIAEARIFTQRDLPPSPPAASRL
ncbi:hypothetical protein VDG03_18385 [Xanthomonas campestris pv. raphani]|uniref:hypothetical protein n=1 Tax=Xanthomonas campestris TaxID=339 RepID=UPI001F3C3065|nr:hypothetical protein [Xanthomonas campestris]MCF8828576.1 hypothetical protein [Xanthomonas campestris pv. raphani]MEA9752945.1 hypothetical protein [Xanthomonas campestris pv. raphani]MEA9813173.1 hypothetical protein [Xanthomonas campestris pv. raphani]MEA9935303.1 hypothetical protein [Xanthomonas campestris pv. raphani]WDJ08212.1 hypothetical protein JH261_20840 [Xanthomonas campestris pv. incanae]